MPLLVITPKSLAEYLGRPMAVGAAVLAIPYPVALAGAFLAVCWAAGMAAFS